ncbi:hypothetical protein AZA_32389 [Nitrospirillum viridazoti Y2]|uniref:Uncharacterized protein n=1 Tax=Nitrospirillum amazonense TaxID=28077 RepID=A0A560IAQ7_9PROT|nr:LPO_1073/Vpar_1526 family protein [Nitrospirillum amazonense]EGY02537.1 hypothetical protein AZA_32389 [Nitrospirillum amazonense Y2]TWB56112.1 hypothetical protein FBZ92_113106 [Nitrospirillum amazonense]
MANHKQDQTAEGGATAIQAGGDIHYHTGLSISDVREICTLYLRDNFPRLQESARQIAEENVWQFGEGLEKRLSEKISTILLEKLAEPDVQASINDAVIIAARKGQAANTDILVELIIDRIKSDSSPFYDIVISEAISVAGKLTKEQISFLTAIFCARDLSLTASAIELEELFSYIGPLVEDGLTISMPKKLHTNYLGLTVFSQTFSIDIYHQLATGNYRHLGYGGAFKEGIQANIPSFFKFIDQFSTNFLTNWALTGVGQAIVSANFSRLGDKLDIADWFR